MTWTPIRDGRDAAFRAAVTLVFLFLIAGVGTVAWMLLPILSSQQLTGILCGVVGYVLGRWSR